MSHVAAVDKNPHVHIRETQACTNTMPPPHEVEFTIALLWLLVVDTDACHTGMGLCAEHQHNNDTYMDRMSYTKI